MKDNKKNTTNNSNLAIKQQSAYEVLGVSGSTNIDEIKRKYKELIRVNSPERDPNKFMEIRNAYESITKPTIKVETIPFYRAPLSILKNKESNSETQKFHINILKEIFETPFNLESDLYSSVTQSKF